MTAGRPSLRVGLAGLGGVGLDVARRLIDGIDGLTLAAISVRAADKARRDDPANDKTLSPFFCSPVNK